MIVRIVTHSTIEELSYIGCTKCRKKLVGGYCERCESNQEGKWAYSFSIQVSDGTGTLDVQVFDREGEELIGATAERLVRMEDPSENLTSFRRKVSMRDDE